MNAHEVQSALPDPDDREPPALRRDIADELADHLACAIRREQRRTDDQPQARRAALEKFGNPSAIARKLYFDAMKEAFMKDRILITAIALLSLICLASVALSWHTVSQSRQISEGLLARLEKLGAAAPAPAENLEWTHATVSIRIGTESGAPAEGWTVFMSGPAINPGQNIQLQESTDASGMVRFGPIRPGQYSLGGWGEWAGWNVQKVILPGQPLDLKLVAPARPEIVTLNPVVHWPRNITDGKTSLSLAMEISMDSSQSSDDPGQATWYPVFPRVFLITPEGSIVQFTRRLGDRLHRETSDIAAIALPRARYTVQARLIQGTLKLTAGSFSPLGKPFDKQELDLTTGPAQRDWEILVPDALLQP